MNAFFRLKEFLKYQQRAKTKYYLHSPFVYQFFLNVLEGKEDEALKKISSMRKNLRNDNRIISLSDFGTGNSSSQKISTLEKKVAVRKKYGALLYHLVKYFQPSTILELGTSIGLSSSYIALANPNAKIISLEASAQLIDEAKKNHHTLRIKNAKIISGEFDASLPKAFGEFSTLDFTFFDGNHKKEATLKYFEQCLLKANEHSVFVFDDIYWSEEMRSAWEEIKLHPSVTLTIDVFQFGICFFRREKLAKENFMLRY